MNGLIRDYEEHLTDSDRVVIAFAGGNQNRYQWGPTLKRLGVSHVLFQCSRQVYYQDGIVGIGDRDATCEYIRFLRSTRHVTTVGVSSGAYGALLYAQLAPVDRCVVFSPLTGRSLEDFEPQWHQQIWDPSMPNMLDLKHVFNGKPNHEATAYISDHYPTCALDGIMAKRVGITDIHMVPGYQHGDLARGMRDRGMLDEIFR